MFVDFYCIENLVPLHLSKAQNPLLKLLELPFSHRFNSLFFDPQKPLFREISAHDVVPCFFINEIIAFELRFCKGEKCRFLGENGRKSRFWRIVDDILLV